MITYKRVKTIEADKLAELFLSVNWFSGKFPEKLRLAFIHSSRVISAWDHDKLVGLIRGLDDGIWQATIDCLLVNPDYQGRGIASALLQMMLGDYEEFLYVDVLPDKGNAQFYLKHGFRLTEERAPLQIVGKSWGTVGE
ncbi:MAG: GNAT family N-acetyltransferase [Oscillospiraceae bacterium]|nr:GNAT family N-acetyltransferase [Oscillospiraceae bacterium]